MKISQALLFINLFLLNSSLLFADNKTDRVNKQSSVTLEQKVIAISQQFLGIPYQFNPLGEGPTGKYDQQPLYRTDVFDCVTYVETVLALAHANSLVQFQQLMNTIRYQHGRPNYLERNHFMTIDWIPNNQKKGFVNDITLRFKNNAGQPVAKMATTTFDKANWYAHAAKNNKKMSPLIQITKNIKPESADLAYLSITDILDKKDHIKVEIIEQFPEVSIVAIVRPNWNIKNKIGTNINISHLGFVIKKQGELYFRDASTIEKKVIDTPLSQYLSKFKHSKTIKGIHILSIQQKPFKSSITRLSNAQKN